MYLLKISLAIALTLFACWILFLIATFDPEKELNLSLEYFLKGDVEHSSEVLARLQSSFPPSQFNLYRAYLERASNDLEASNKDLEAAEKDAENHANFSLLLEILLNESLNAYLIHSDKDLNLSVKKAAKFGGPTDDWVLIFRGLVEYNKGNYGEMLTLWRASSSRQPLSPWMQKAFEQVFTPYWFMIHTTKASIEDGKFQSAREQLEGEVPNLSGEELSEALFLIGYSYAKQAATKNPLDAMPFYKLALTYLTKVPFQDKKYQKEREGLIRQINSQAELMIHENRYDYFSFYLNLLNQWQANNATQHLKTLLLSQFHNAMALQSLKEAQEIFGLLQGLIPEGEERQSLEAELQDEVTKKALDALEQDARTGRLFSEEPLTPSIEQKKPSIIDSTSELIPIQALLEKAIHDHQLNNKFDVQRSTDLQRAVRQLDSYTKVHPGVPQGFVMLGQVRYLLGDLKRASEAYAEAINLDAREPFTYLYMALVYEDAGQPHDAVLLLLQALKYAPKNAKIWEQLGDLYIKTGNELDALPSYKEALLIDPDRYEVYLSLGRLQIRIEMPEEARKNLEIFLTYQPENKEALTLLLMALYNPLINVEIRDIDELEKQRNEIYDRLYKIAPNDAERIKGNFRAPPAIISPPPQPEPNLPFLPQ